MRPLLYSALAVTLYALNNVILKLQLTGYSTPALMLIVYSTMLPLTIGRFGFAQLSGEAMLIPRGDALVMALVVGVIYFLADYFFLGAYAAGGNLTTITTMTTMMPVLASLMLFMWTGSVPNAWLIAGYVLAVGAIFCVVRGTYVAAPG